MSKDNVINLNVYIEGKRKKKVKATVTKPVKIVYDGPRYHCTRCNADIFNIADTGNIHCADCGATMSNITAQPPGAR